MNENGLELDEGELDSDAMKEFDAFMESLESLPRSEVMVLNAVRVYDMRVAYGMLHKCFELGDGVKVVCKQSDVAQDVGYISIEGISVEITNSKEFAKIAALSSNTEVYPLANNKVRLTLGFNHLMIPLG